MNENVDTRWNIVPDDTDDPIGFSLEISRGRAGRLWLEVQLADENATPTFAGEWFWTVDRFVGDDYYGTRVGDGWAHSVEDAQAAALDAASAEFDQ